MGIMELDMIIPDATDDEKERARTICMSQPDWEYMWDVLGLNID